ncbi:MAG: hypothetical protein AAF488_06445 [Planctomycetota bacterium]
MFLCKCLWVVLAIGAPESPASDAHLESRERTEESLRIENLERRLAELEQAQEQSAPQSSDSWSLATDPSAWFRRFTLGGYGEIHANLGEGPSNDQVDIHRFVLFLGYEFEDWLVLTSETEIEHAFINDDDGEISIEQLYIDVLIRDGFNVRAGRLLTPVGIVNQKHEPPSFNGVERPLFARVVVPTTWSSDGVGIFGRVSPEVKYQLYAVTGLDGSGFSATSGIRGGRIKERPSLNEPAVTGRVDFFPLARRAAGGQVLRVGLSGYGGGLDNGDQGRDPNINGELLMGAVDFEYSIGIVDLRGAGAYQKITGTRQIGGGVATDIFGGYVECGVHVLPEDCKTGKLSESDLVLFVRYDRVNTQYKLRSGVADDPAGDREEVTAGFTWFFNPSIVFKGDVQIRNDGRAGDLPALVNFGLGWEF